MGKVYDMPTSLRTVLDSFPEQDLEKLARDKIDDFEHLRLPKSVLIEELFNLLTSPSYIHDQMAFRSPPSFEILSVLLNSKGYSCDIQGFRSKVLETTDTLIEKTKTLDLQQSKRGLGLYLKVLETAWQNENYIQRAEAKLLETLREELGIIFIEHFILEHHPLIRGFWDGGNPFQRERNHLLHAGIIYINEEENQYVLPEEIAYKALRLWEIDLDNYDYTRLLNYLTKSDLKQVLRDFDYPVSGSKDELVRRIVENHIPPHVAMDILPKPSSKRVCEAVDAKVSGAKDTVINRLINYFRYDRDLLTEEEEQDTEPELVEEEKALSEDNFTNLFLCFTSNELYEILSQIPSLVVYGTKKEKIERLWKSHLSERSLLNLLTRREIQEACRSNNLHVSGRKEELIDRLLDHYLSKNARKDSLDETEKDVKQRESKKPDKTEIPNYALIHQKFDFLNEDQRIILASLLNFGSLSEAEIDRIVSRYDLSWMFYKPEMKELIRSLEEQGFTGIEIHSKENQNWYSLQPGKEFLN